MDNIQETRENELITREHPKSPITEAFRSIRTNLSFLSPDKPLQSILITGGGASVGKSLVLVNLAISIAQNEKKVIIIDADMRRPMLHRFFGMTNFGGLSNILTNEDTFENVLRETDIENLKVISAGIIPPNPAELLSSKKMEEVLKKAQNNADMILIDSPPAVAVTDPVIISNKVDGVILVVASHQTQKDLLQSAQENLEKANANIIGTILNKYPVKKSRYYQKYYYSSYGSQTKA